MGASGTGEDGVNSLQRQSCTDYSKNWTKHIMNNYLRTAKTKQ